MSLPGGLHAEGCSVFSALFAIFPPSLLKFTGDTGNDPIDPSRGACNYSCAGLRILPDMMRPQVVASQEGA